MLGIPYLSKHPDKCFNVSILPVACPHLTSKFFGLVNDLDLQNKSRQSDLALGKFWEAQFGCALMLIWG